MHNSFNQSKIGDCHIYDFGIIGEENYIIPVSFLNCPFKVKRVFSVCDSNGNVRGMHAHKKCNQLIICITGSIELKLDDGKTKKSCSITKGTGVLIPAGIWSEQTYHGDQTVINVLCDTEYMEKEYIRDYGEFISLKI